MSKSTTATEMTKIEEKSASGPKTSEEKALMKKTLDEKSTATPSTVKTEASNPTQMPAADGTAYTASITESVALWLARMQASGPFDESVVTSIENLRPLLRVHSTTTAIERLDNALEEYRRRMAEPNVPPTTEPTGQKAEDAEYDTPFTDTVTRRLTRLTLTEIFDDSVVTSVENLRPLLRVHSTTTAIERLDNALEEYRRRMAEPNVPPTTEPTGQKAEDAEYDTPFTDTVTRRLTKLTLTEIFDDSVVTSVENLRPLLRVHSTTSAIERLDTALEEYRRRMAQRNMDPTTEATGQRTEDVEYDTQITHTVTRRLTRLTMTGLFDEKKSTTLDEKSTATPSTVKIEASLPTQMPAADGTAYTASIAESVALRLAQLQASGPFDESVVTSVEHVTPLLRAHVRPDAMELINTKLSDYKRSIAMSTTTATEMTKIEEKSASGPKTSEEKAHMKKTLDEKSTTTPSTAKTEASVSTTQVPAVTTQPTRLQ